jgi:hypothetical protein
MQNAPAFGLLGEISTARLRPYTSSFAAGLSTFLGSGPAANHGPSRPRHGEWRKTPTLEPGGALPPVPVMVAHHIEWRMVSLNAIARHNYTFSTNYDSESPDVLDNETLVMCQGEIFYQGGMVGRAMKLELV